jgi:putative SOS response-associated peptidase YedK
VGIDPWFAKSEKLTYSTDKQDKRSVVSIELQDVDQWLHGTPDEARQLIRLTPAELFDASPVDR